MIKLTDITSVMDGNEHIIIDGHDDVRDIVATFFVGQVVDMPQFHYELYVDKITKRGGIIRLMVPTNFKKVTI